MNKHSTSVARVGRLNRLQIKWGIESASQVLLMLLVFSLSGSSVVFLRKARTH